MAYANIQVLAGKNQIKSGKLQVPDLPIIPYVEGDARAATSGDQPGVGCWLPRLTTVNAIHWMEVFAGEKSFKVSSWLPDETTQAFKEFLVGIKGPLTTPIGGGSAR
jgi:isocitrate dehydrogenase